MITPTIHTNGTSENELYEQLTEAGGAIRVAIKALEAAAPNPRDYYTQGDDAFRQATSEHQSRAERMQSVLNELTDIMNDTF